MNIIKIQVILIIIWVVINLKKFNLITRSKQIKKAVEEIFHTAKIQRCLTQAKRQILEKFISLYYTYFTLSLNFE